MTIETCCLPSDMMTVDLFYQDKRVRPTFRKVRMRNSVTYIVGKNCHSTQQQKKSRRAHSNKKKQKSIRDKTNVYMTCVSISSTTLSISVPEHHHHKYHTESFNAYNKNHKKIIIPHRQKRRQKQKKQVHMTNYLRQGPYIALQFFSHFYF